MVKRVLAGILIFLFIVVSLPTFLFFGVSNSFLRPSFYDGEVVDVTYNFMLDVTAKNLFAQDSIISSFFNESEIKAEMVNVFPVALFKGVFTDFSSQISSLKEKPDKPITVSLKVFRESLLTFSNNLSFKLFQKLPICVGGQMPEVDMKGLPTCIPEGVEYNKVTAPLTQRFEATIYSVVPEQIQIDLNAQIGDSNVTPAVLMTWFMYLKYILYGSLLFLLAAIALFVYAPFSLIVKYEGIAFAFSGIAGYLLSLCVSLIPSFMVNDIGTSGDGVELHKFLQYIVSFVSAESQKIALIFLALGAILILMRVFLKHKYSGEKFE
jgi:hypothetical protein